MSILFTQLLFRIYWFVEIDCLLFIVWIQCSWKVEVFLGSGGASIFFLSLCLRNERTTRSSSLLDDSISYHEFSQQ